MGQLNEFEELRGILFEIDEQRILTTSYTPYQEALLKDAKALLILLRTEAQNCEVHSKFAKTLEVVSAASEKLKTSSHPQALTEAYNAINELISESL